MPLPLTLLGRPLVAGLTAFTIACLLTPLVRWVALRQGWVSRPVEDRWGRRVVARFGGVAIYCGVVVSTLAVGARGPQIWALVLGLTLALGWGLVDDWRRLPPYTKLIGQLLIGILIVLGGIRAEIVPWPSVALIVSILWCVFVMNALNLLDNMDGLAAGIAAIAAAFCAVHAGWQAQWGLSVVAAAVSGACLGFLWHNFPPAKIFMGDAGSQSIGLALAALALLGRWEHSAGVLSVLAVPTLVLAVPIFDTCFVTIQRLLNRQHPFVGGVDHVSHRLAILGLTVRQTVLALYGVSLCLGLLSIATARLRALPMVAGWLSIATGLVLFGRYLGRVKVYRIEPQAGKRGASAAERVTPIETSLQHKRRILEVLVDFVLLSSAYMFAHLLRFEGALSQDLQELLVRSLPVVLAIKLSCFTLYGLYRGVWRYLGLADAVMIAKSATVASLLSAVALLYLWRFEGFSRAVLIIDWLLTLLVVGGSRAAERLFDQWIQQAAAQGPNTLIVGAGDTAERVLRYMRYERQQRRRIVGLIDDDPRMRGISIHGYMVLGGRDKLPRLLQERQVKEVLVAIVDPPGELLQDIRRCCEPLGVTWQVVTAGVMHAA